MTAQRRPSSAQHWTAIAPPPPNIDTRFSTKIVVVIPCYRVREEILRVITAIPAFIERILVVDDACPQRTGQHVLERNTDPRVVVHFHETNTGVGGAMITGYKAALEIGADIIVKMDGDGQMDPAALMPLIGPILRGQADYTKGNRFYDLSHIRRMPKLRILGNAALSFLTKFSSGYWDIFDPTNGYTAVHSRVLARLPFSKISRRYFFETDMLFRLNIIRAVVTDVPMDARYGSESSNLMVSRILLDFSAKHIRNTCKRVFYNYFLRDLSLASFELVLGGMLMLVGLGMGLFFWTESASTGVVTSAGSVMLVALQIIVGLQLVLGFLAYDIASVPRQPQHPLLD